MTRASGDPSTDRRAAAAARRERRAAVTDPGIVMEAAARLLAARSRSVSEMHHRLLRLGYPGALVEETLERLLAMGYLDDGAFARAWIESRDRSRPRGSAALRQELRRMGIDDAVVRGALEDRATGVDIGRPGDPPEAERDIARPSADRAAADRLLSRRSAALAREPDVRRRRQRAYALLARNGFDPAICREASASVASPDARADSPDHDPDPDAWHPDPADGP